MDLDKLKESWQKAEIHPNISDDRIQSILENRNRGNFNFLIKTEKHFLILDIVVMLLGCLFGFVNYIFILLYVGLLLPACFWQLYKIRFLKKTDMLSMGIVEISIRINKYRRFIIWEIIASIPVGLLFMLTFAIVVTHPKDYTFHSLIPAFMLIAVTVVMTVAICIPIYLNMYMRTIKRIQQSIKEVEEFEKEEN